jgi:transcriptional regulator with XRE-family HTH domain
VCQRIQPAKIVLTARGTTHREVAAQIGRTPSYVGRVLNGQVRPSQQFRADLAAALDLPVDQLFTDAPCTCRIEPSRAQLGSLLAAARAS